MNIFKELADQYFEIDQIYGTEVFKAQSKRATRKEAYWSRKRELNDQTYFLFMFTRLEGRIRDLSYSLITNKIRSLHSWRQKAPWQNLDDRGLHFMKRVALLTDQTQADYALIKNYYDTRNELGHGKNPTNAPIMTTVINDMQRLYKDLAK